MAWQGIYHIVIIDIIIAIIITITIIIISAIMQYLHRSTYIIIIFIVIIALSSSLAPLIVIIVIIIIMQFYGALTWRWRVTRRGGMRRGGALAGASKGHRPQEESGKVREPDGGSAEAPQ
jgi:chromate transport protein ChrA